MAEESAKQRRTVYFAGRVQGVGFRYETRSVAQNYDVTGFVKNLDDGRVLLVAEGAAEEIDRFLKQLMESMGRFVRHVDATVSPATDEFGGFTIER